MTEFEEQTPETFIIDATQSAVIDAVNSVSQLIEKQTQTTPLQAKEPSPAFYLSAEFWVGMAFVLAVLVIVRPAFKALKGLLEKRRSHIINTLNEAEGLHIEAQKLLAAYERKFQNAQKEIEDMARQAADEVNAYALSKNELLEKELLGKQTEAENIIRRVVDDARAQMRLAVSKQSIDIVHDYLKKNLNEQKRAEMIDSSIERIIQEL